MRCAPERKLNSTDDNETECAVRCDGQFVVASGVRVHWQRHEGVVSFRKHRRLEYITERSKNDHKNRMRLFFDSKNSEIRLAKRYAMRYRLMKSNTIAAETDKGVCDVDVLVCRTAFQYGTHIHVTAV